MLERRKPEVDADLRTLGLAEIERRLAAGPLIPGHGMAAAVSCVPDEPSSCPWWPDDPWPDDGREPPA